MVTKKKTAEKSTTARKKTTAGRKSAAKKTAGTLSESEQAIGKRKNMSRSAGRSAGKKRSTKRAPNGALATASSAWQQIVARGQQGLKTLKRQVAKAEAKTRKLLTTSRVGAV